MGTIISLDLGGLELVSSKNHRGMDHGALFQVHDRKRVRSDQINYAYFEREGENPGAMEMAFARKLKDVLPRLDLLGYTLANAKAAYENWARTWAEDQADLADSLPGHSEPEPLPFDEFLAFAVRYSVSDLDNTYVDYDGQKRDGAPKGRFAGDDALVERIPKDMDHDNTSWSERSYFGAAINVLHPYFMLQILGQNAANRETDVLWQYGPLVEAGWAQESEFAGAARRNETFLLATEGSSDAHILQHALKLLRPEVLDFFRFIDVSERHPFSGTGNLVKFAEGLAKIDVHNQIVFVFDNDAEGVEAHRRVLALNLPVNMRAMLLPDLEAFQTFPTRGPEGAGQADINGRGAAIECYLDHRLHHYPPPKVVWTNFKPDLDAYHGALEHKESYAKAFIALKAEDLASYDTAKITRVLDAVVAECVSIVRGDLATKFELSKTA